MPQISRSQRPKPTKSAFAAESGASLASSRKRKMAALKTPANTQPDSNKRIKTETTTPTAPKVAESVGKVSNSIYDTIVDFKIGEDLTNFGIHREVLRRASSFFKERLPTSETTKSNIVTHSVVIKDEDPDIFRRFVTWLYSRKITLESETYMNTPWQIIIEVYSFAERNGIPHLQNTCVDTVIRKRRDGGLFPGQGDVNRLWECPGNISQLRKLLLDLFATECNLKNAIASNGSYHSRFLQGLVQVLYDMKVKNTIYKEVDFWEKRQNYYVYDNENPIVVD
ncbi:MAG: hypothetical protein Q9175_005177 [Cornicularia normoerica]